MLNGNKEAETAVIGALLMESETVGPQAFSKLIPEDFKTPQYRRVFEASKDLFQEGKPVDAVTVLGKLDSSYNEVLVYAAQMTPTINHYDSYIQIVADTSKKLRAYSLAVDLIAQLEEGEELTTCQEAAVKVCESLSSTASDKVVSAKEGYSQFYQRKMKPKEYMKTGFMLLDKHIYLDRGDYLVVGGRPSSGKTALTLQMALQMARDYKVAYFSLETSAEKIYDRLVASYTRTPMDQVKTAQIEDWGPVARGYDPFSNLNLFVIEAAGWTVQQVKAKAVQLGAEILFIDYLSLLKGEGKSLYERVTNISIDLHTMAQQSKMAVVALSQLNRAGDGEPDMTSLRESGQIEQDADVILLLHNTDRDNPNAQRKLIIAKNKEGSVGAIPLAFDGRFQRFTQIETRYSA